MLKKVAVFTLVLALLHCGGRAPVRAPAEQLAPTQQPTLANAGGSPDAGAAVDADAGADSSDLVIDAGKPPPPPPVVRSGTRWPFHKWTRGEAVTFNQMPYEHIRKLVAYDEFGWNTTIARRTALTLAQAQQSERRVFATLGGVAVSKCSQPRHAVILYDEDIPVASINVCFDCGDIEIWPTWEPKPNWDSMSNAQFQAFENKHARQMQLYKRVFPAWRAFFDVELKELNER